jgi:hypothetical protein
LVKGRHAIGVSLLAVMIVASAGAVLAQSDGAPTMALTVAAGRPLQILLDHRITIKTVGQPVTGTLVEPLYAYDRIVVPAGRPVRGHVAALEPLSKTARTVSLRAGSSPGARGGTPVGVDAVGAGERRRSRGARR